MQRSLCGLFACFLIFAGFISDAHSAGGFSGGGVVPPPAPVPQPRTVFIRQPVNVEVKVDLKPLQQDMLRIQGNILQLQKQIMNLQMEMIQLIKALAAAPNAETKAELAQKLEKLEKEFKEQSVNLGNEISAQKLAEAKLKELTENTYGGPDAPTEPGKRNGPDDLTVKSIASDGSYFTTQDGYIYEVESGKRIFVAAWRSGAVLKEIVQVTMDGAQLYKATADDLNTVLMRRLREIPKGR